ncbi:MAG: hypothetical protein AB1757_10420 [Acidobacteriota bacterium]
MKRKLPFLVTMIGVCLLVGCTFYETDKANKVVDVANAAIKDANENLTKGGQLLVKMEQAVASIEEDQDLEAARAQAKEAIATLEKARDKYKESGEKFIEASKFKLQDKYKEYLEAKGAEMKKRAEYVDVVIGEPKALLDTESKADYQAKVKDVVSKSDAVKKDADDLEAKAKKIQDENKDLFAKETK